MGYLRRLAPYLLLTGLWALFFWRFAAPQASDRVTYAAGDFSQQFGVFRGLVYRSALEGRLPLWADCLDAGYPLYADPQTQLFYPPIWLPMAWLRAQGWGHYPLGALAAEAAGHYLLASWLLFAFLRTRRLGVWPALLGSVVYGYGGYLTGSPPLQTATLETATWLPLALLAAGRLAETRRPAWLALAAAALALAFLAGHPQTFVYVALLTSAYFGYRAREARWSWATAGSTLGVLAGLSAGLAAIQLLPSAHFILGHSTRAGLTFVQAGHGFPFQDVVQLVLPGLVSYWSPLYVGVLPLGLAALALHQRWSEVRFWAGAALVGLVWSFGAKAVAFEAIYLLAPGMRLFQSQERLALVVSISVAVLAAYGAQAVLAPLSRASRRVVGRLTRAAGWLLAGAAGLLVLVIVAARLGVGPEEGQRLTDGLGLLVFHAGLALAALAIRARVPAWRRAAPALFVVVTVLDLFSTSRPLNIVPAYEPYPFNPLLAAIDETPGFFRVQDDAQLAGHAGCAYGYRSIESVTPYRVATYEAFMRRVPEEVRWRLLGVGFVVSWRAELFSANGALIPTEVTARGTTPDERGNVTTVHRLPDEPRRAFLATRVSVAEEAAAYDLMAAEGFEPHRDVILPVEVEAGDASGSVRVLADAPGRVRVEVSSAGPAVLVLSESYFPGWRAQVDGRPAPVLPADGALLGVALPAGAHMVTFEFRPAVLGWGAALSLFTLAAWAVLLWLDRRGRRIL